MSGRIVIVDGIATNRIILRAILTRAHYDVIPCPSVSAARDQLLVEPTPDLLIVDLCDSRSDALRLCAEIKANPALAGVRVIGLAAVDGAGIRIAALRAGVDDVLDKSVTEGLLLATIRNLIRARNAAQLLALRGDGDRVTGFADAAEGFTHAGRATLVTTRPSALPAVLRKVIDRLPGPTTMAVPGPDLGAGTGAAPSDLYILDGGAFLSDGHQPAELYPIVSDMYVRASAQHAATLVMIPQDMPELAAMVLDLGADDQVGEDVAAEELAHRIKGLMRRKQGADRQRDQLQSELQAANVDSLTGLANRRHGLRRLERMIDTARAAGQDFAVMMLDIDHFKQINDTFGHIAGDKVLAEVARRLRDNLRAVDLVARIGGEEFLVAMPETTVEQAEGAAERLRRVIDALPFDGQDGGIRVTLSIGVAVAPADTPPGMPVETMIERLFERADHALYGSKSSGRNTVTVWRSAA